MTGKTTEEIKEICAKHAVTFEGHEWTFGAFIAYGGKYIPVTFEERTEFLPEHLEFYIHERSIKYRWTRSEWTITCTPEGIGEFVCEWETPEHSISAEKRLPFVVIRAFMRIWEEIAGHAHP